MRYRADLTAGGLKISESRRIADLLLQGLNQAEWDREVYERNVLQTKSQETARRFQRLLKKRLSTMDSELWSLIRDGSREVAAHACLAAAVKHSALLGDFMELVLRDLYRTLAEKLTKNDWDNYVADCQRRDPEMPEWTKETVRRLRSSVYQTLAEAGYIDGTRTRRLQAVYIAKPVLSYLEHRGESYVLRCIQVGP